MFERQFTWASSSNNNPPFFSEGAFPSEDRQVLARVYSEQEHITLGDTVTINGKSYTYIGHFNEEFNPVGTDPDPYINDAYAFKAGDGEYLLLSDPILGASPPLTAENIESRLDTDVDLIVCFMAGTLIATPDGPRAVETLQAGDLVCTADGRSVPVIWIGRQTVHKLFTPSERFCPIRIRAGALAPGLPQRDLLVTGDHAIMLDGLAINAAALVNGRSILREPKDALPETLTYWHIETENHEVVLAEGAPAETFVDNVTRRRFDNYAEYEARFGSERRHIEESPAPRVMSPRQLPQTIRARMARRAAELEKTAAAA